MIHYIKENKKIDKNLTIKIFGKLTKNYFKNVTQTLNLLRQPVNVLKQLFSIIR